MLDGDIVVRIDSLNYNHNHNFDYKGLSCSNCRCDIVLDDMDLVDRGYLTYSYYGFHCSYHLTDDDC